MESFYNAISCAKRQRVKLMMAQEQHFEQNSDSKTSSENVEVDAMVPPAFKVCCIILTLIGIGASIFHLFGYNIAGKVMWPRAYYSLLIGCFLPLIFLYDSPGRQFSWKKWLNLLGALITVGTAAFFFLNAFNIEYKSWEYNAPTSAIFGAFTLLIVIFWALKKSSGTSFFLIAVCFLCFPLFAQHIPGALKGTGFTPLEALQYYAFGTEAVFGLVMDVMGNLVLGFLVFAGVLQYTGGGKFFLDLAFALVGKSRGGPAKVAVIASGFFGSINGAPIVNVASTGAITIPAMKKLGYSATYAGAIEACASTGGVFMPPIMGATAFIMCQVLGVSYSVIITAAFIPALLFYLSLLLQVDAYAVKADLKGLSTEDIPPLWATLKEGWPFLISLGYLVFQLVYLRVVVLAPYYATILLLISVMVRKRTRLNLDGWMEMIEDTGKMIASIISLLLGVGFILGALMMTGVAFAFSHEIIKLAMGDPMLLLILGAVISFFLGMGMTISAVYVILAMTVAPPLVKMGFDPLAVHLFVIYYGMLSSITPPVALAAFGAAAISGASPLKTGFMAVRIGIILFIVPFVFVLQPALIFQGPIIETIYLFLTFLIGIVFVVGGTEGYVYGLGTLGNVFYSLKRVASLIGGLLIIAPNIYAKMAGAIVIIVLISMVYFKGKSSRLSITSV